MPTTQYTKRYGIYRMKTYEEVVPILKFISMNAEAQLKFPTMKVLKAIAKKLLLNVYQALVLSFNAKSGWPFQNSFFIENSRNVRDIIFYRRPQEAYGPILTFLLLQTAAIKMTLNDNFRIYTAELESTLPNFRPILAEFMLRFPLQEPTPKELNLVYKEMLAFKDEGDYQDIVDNIMHLCPTYRLNGQSEDASSCTNTFTNKKVYSTKYPPNYRQIQTRRFELMSQNSELERPIMEEDESKGGSQFFRFQSQECSRNHPQYFN